MPSKKMSKEQSNVFVFGGILVVLGIYVIISSDDWKGGFFLVGLGIVFMASSNQEWAQNVWNLFFDFFKGLFSLLTRK